MVQTVKNLPAMWETWVWSLCWDVPWRKKWATHSSILVWRVPLTEEPRRLQFIGSQSQTQLSDLHYNVFSSPFSILAIDFHQIQSDLVTCVLNNWQKVTWDCKSSQNISKCLWLHRLFILCSFSLIYWLKYLLDWLFLRYIASRLDYLQTKEKYIWEGRVVY